MNSIKKLQFGELEKIVVLTGSGVSAESGIRTFRDMAGLWEEYDVYEVASPQGWKKNPSLVWKFYSERRKQALVCKPNPAHFAITKLEERIGTERFLLITQNVDGLHKKAGTKNIIEIHGSLFRSRCSNDLCIGAKESFFDESLYFEKIPSCPSCNSLIRPDIVWFGEFLSPSLERKARDSLFQCSILIVVGTSGVVYPVAGYPYLAKSRGAKTILVNKDPPQNLEIFDEFYEGLAGEILPLLI